MDRGEGLRGVLSCDLACDPARIPRGSLPDMLRTPSLTCTLALVLLTAAPGLAQEAPRHVVFTWRGDTGTTLCMCYQTFSRRPVAARAYYDTVPRGGSVQDYRFRAKGRSFRIPGLDDRWIHRIELTGLKPGGVVYLCAGDPEAGISKEYKVRTMAHDDRPLRFVTGGDMGPGVDTRLLLRQAARTSPDIALVGGDIAYANGRLEFIDRWDSWLTYYTEEMVTPAGFAIPLILAMGNHEVRGGSSRHKEHAPFYFGFFGQDERSYFARRLGANLLFLVLDTGHIVEHGGAQERWIDKTLSDNAGVRFKAAIYHIPLYPSHRDFSDKMSVAGRSRWVPLFDRHRLTVAFEHHDHTWKRTHLLRANKVAPDGVLYLGDGCWGRVPRRVTYGGRWYLRKQASIAHFWQVDVRRSGMTYRAIDRRGRVFDVYPEDVAGATAARRVFRGVKSRYFLPPNVVSVAPLFCADPTWRGGSTTVRVTNPFEAPVEVHVVLRRAPRGVTVKPPGIVHVDAGKACRVPVQLSASRPISTDRLRVQLLIRFIHRPAGEPIDMADTFHVPVERLTSPAPNTQQR